MRPTKSQPVTEKLASLGSVKSFWSRMYTGRVISLKLSDKWGDPLWSLSIRRGGIASAVHWSACGTFRTWPVGLTMSDHRGKAYFPASCPGGGRLWPLSDVGRFHGSYWMRRRRNCWRCRGGRVCKRQPWKFESQSSLAKSNAVSWPRFNSSSTRSKQALTKPRLLSDRAFWGAFVCWLAASYSRGAYNGHRPRRTRYLD